MGSTMTHTQTHVELSVKQIIEALEIPRSTFERWRDEVYGGENGVGDPPYSQDKLKIILENAEKKAASAFGASKNKNTRKISRILRSL